MRRGSRTNEVERLKHHLEKGRLKLVAREIYAVVPPDVGPAQFHPDPFLTAVAARADAVFSHHSALELLGAAHSIWTQVTLYTGRRRRSLRLNGSILRFMEHPGAMRSISSRDFGTRRVERRGKILSGEVLSRLERRRPRSPQYLERSNRGGWLASRWNLILPNSLKPAGGVGEP